MNIKNIRTNFPILSRKINDKPITYFDNACMTFCPNQVIEAINEYYCTISACAGRSIHKLGSEITLRYQEAREKIQNFINARESREIIFTKNATEGINLVARSLFLNEDDIVLTTDKEHNSNLVPWHLQKHFRKICHTVVESKTDNSFDIERFKHMMSKKVKLVSMVHTSNLDGYTIPAREIIEIAHDYGALVLLDGAQSAPRKPIDVQLLDVDFFVFSAHKMLGPSGFGILYGKSHILEELSPFMVGGNTVENSTYDSSILLPIPEKFEAGIQNYVGAIGTVAAVDFINKIGKENIEKHEYVLNRFIYDNISEIPGVNIIGPIDPKLRSGIVTFTIENHEPHDIVMRLDDSNIMCRSGVLCVHSWFNTHHINGAIRVSLYLYNTKDECEIFLTKLNEIIK